MEVNAAKEGCLAFVPLIWLSTVELVQVLVMLFASCWTGYSTKVYYDSSTNKHLTCGSKNASVTAQCWQSYQKNIGLYSLPYWAFVVLQCFVYAAPWTIFWIFQRSRAKHLAEIVSSLHPRSLEEVVIVNRPLSDYHNTAFFRWHNIQTSTRIILLVSITIVHALFFNTGNILCHFENTAFNCVLPNWEVPLIGVYVSNGTLLLLLFVEVVVHIRFWMWVCEEKQARQDYQDLLWFASSCEKKDYKAIWQRIAVPGPPRSCSVVFPDEDTVKIQWEAGDNTSYVTGYKVEQRVSPDGSWEFVCELDQTGNEKTVNNLDAFTTYEFRVKAINNYGESIASNAVTVFRCPHGPRLTACSAISRNSVYLIWSRPTDIADILEYNVQWQLKGTNDWHSQNVISINTTIADLRMGACYLFRVRAKVRRGYGEWSDVMEESVSGERPIMLLGYDSATVELPEIHYVRIIPGTFCVDVIWNLCEYYVIGFEVQWRQRIGEYWQTQYSCDSALTIDGLQCNTAYCFRARVEDERGKYGRWSNEAEVVTLAPVRPVTEPERDYRCCHVL